MWEFRCANIVVYFFNSMLKQRDKEKKIDGMH